MDIELKIEDLLESNGSDFELSKLFKAYIKEYKESLPKIFEESQGKDFLVKHTKKLDHIISLMYKTILRRLFGNYQPMRSSIPIAIIALGSYGREQLCVHSDIDLLIVYEPTAGYNIDLIIEKLLYLAWDAGLKLGHRVHEVSDLFKASNEDITIKTALMEARFITGSSFTWHVTQRELERIRKHNQKEFILAKITEAQQRRKKYPISMQPNIKEGVGGLRDANLLFWVAHTIYGIGSLRELSNELFTDEEYREYRIALELIFRVRSALHIITAKQEDRLLLEHMPRITELLGFKDTFKLASKVLQAGWRINNFTRIFTKKMVRSYIYESENIMTFRHLRIAKGIYLKENRLFASYLLPQQKINTLLELLLSLDDQDYRFDAGFLRLFTYAKITHPLPKSTYKLLSRLLEQEHIYSFLKLFYDAGILHELFTNFKKVLHLPQFDGYHTYPVDLHSIKCVEALENIKDPYVLEIYKSLNKKERQLLKAVVLLHDTGKGRLQDHSEVGAKLIANFTQKVGFSKEQQERASLLVKHHILMSNIAFKEDIYHEKTLYKFMSQIGDETNLKLLYIHTYADINGVGDEIYTSFNSKLLRELYQNALEISQNKERITDASRRLRVEKRIKNLTEFQELPRLLQKKILKVESNLFFFRHSPKDIVEIAKKAKETKEYSYTITPKPSLTIEIFRRIPLNIGYLLAMLSQYDVAGMEIFTLFDEIKYFRIEFQESIEQTMLPELEAIIKDSFDMQKSIPLKSIKIKPNEITIDCDHSMAYANLSLKAANQRGLLAFIMQKFEDLGINIASAKIHSNKKTVRDTFLMTKQNNLCDNTQKIIEKLTKES
ncbi:Possible nucleotidyltransferase [hydrothermal vent metagenome]|uniref:Possible nucleotidyltransferase n=1 Tax=hydrothermal vent metagenome TaxID=652676 RepID=A0A1W1BB40_9ZZZZ